MSVFSLFGKHLSTFFYNFPRVKCNSLSFSKLSYSFITNLNNSTLSPDCFHENVILLTVGTVDFGKKKNIGVSPLVWSPIRKLRVKALIKLSRIFMNIC